MFSRLVFVALCALVCEARAHGDALDQAAPALGHLSFPTSTHSSAAQEAFEQGLLWLHLFEYEHAAAEFQNAEKLDPEFAMAYWGEAMTHTHPIWNEDDREAAQAALAKLGPSPAARAAKAPTAREKAYLDAAERLFGPGTLLERDTRYLDATAAMAKAYPGDDEAQLFHALALLGVTRGDRNTANYLRAAEISKRVLAHNPQHPGAAHYWIHGMDDPEHAAGALPAAQALSKIAPGAGHAQHMTSHIFMALGMWQDVIDANVNAMRVVAEERQRTGQPLVRCGHYPEWLQYSYYQIGRQQDGQQSLMQCIDDVKAALTWYRARPRPEDPDGARLASRIRHYHGSMVAMRAMAVVESETDRTSNAAIALDVSDLGREAGWDDFARGFTAAKGGDFTAANADLAALKSVANLPPEKYEAPRTTDELQIMSLMLEGGIAESMGQLDAAIASARDAARRYDAMPFDFGPPVPIKPPHELAGEMLLQAGRAKEALAEFDLALKTAPGRALSLQGRRTALAMMAPTPSASARIAAALLPLPAPLRDGAAVVELDAAGQAHQIHVGTNAMVCIADTPGDAEFDVRCSLILWVQDCGSGSAKVAARALR